MFYLSRGGAPEGPFEEAHLVRMIQSGELSDGGVCPVGQSQWVALHAMPPFAQALAVRPALAAQPVAQASHDAALGAALGYGPGPTLIDPVSAPSPTEPDRAPGPGPTQPDYAPQPGYGVPLSNAQALTDAQPGYGAPAQPNAVAGKGINKALLFGGIAAALVLVLAIAGIGAYLIFFSSGGAPRIAESVPQDCEFLIEVPSVRKLVSDLHDVQFLDTSLRDDQQVFDNTAASLAKAFDISPADAVALLASSETFGIAGRNLASTPELVLALGVKNGSSIERLLKSPRFEAFGSIGKTGERYRLASKPTQPGQDALLKGLSEAEVVSAVDVDSPDNEVLVWFAPSKLLVVGNSPLVTGVAQVLESGAASIQASPAFEAAAEDFDSKSRFTVFVEPNLFSTLTDPKFKALVDQYFKPQGPITGSLHVKPVGFLTSLTGRISGSKLPRSTAYEAPQVLDLPKRLPEETFAYVAASTKSKLTGVELEKLLFDQIGSAAPSALAAAEQDLQQMEALLGVSASQLIDSAGEQTVIGFSAMPATSFAGLSESPQSLGQFNLTWVLELKDPAQFQKLAAGLRSKILPTLHEVTVTPDGTGFSLAPRGVPVPVTMRVKFLDKYLFVTAGLSTLCDRAEAAFTKGERTLKDEPAHNSALAVLPEKAHVLLWLDTGRITDTLMQNPLLRTQLLSVGLSLDKIHLTGADRVTSALALRSEVSGEQWTYHLDALNLQALVPFASAGSVFGSRVADK